MRVIAGQYRSRTLAAPKGRDVRPTSDRLRETLFNILAPRIPEAIFVDLFAGTGAVGIEAISRGAAHVYFAETARPALAALRANLQSLGIKESGQDGAKRDCTVETRGALPLLRKLAKLRVQADIIFLDPPYADTNAYETTLECLASSPALHADSIVVVEHSSHTDAPKVPVGMEKYRSIVQGDAQVCFYRMHMGAHPVNAVFS
ncbi:MAG TPA: 16S rRNA (guanine(966)-N(2))-methyltransferase RsmD [Acidobacteriaceae bacterium]|nr:16S rRNA (guanine(966)-N(2))-methyltransferase RsmD [Acidobacteriaceae bacterium]